jgi:DeoR family transcriptional regulator, deoxyribose operon repressor
VPTKKRQDRIARIMEVLDISHGASIKELSASLDVSEMTIRRDLELLSDTSRVKLVHAGAIPAMSPGQGYARSYSLLDAAAPAAVEKQRIGEKAASLIEAGDVVILDSGSTIEWLARSIPRELPVTILCYALNVLIEAGHGSTRNVVFAGGSLHIDSMVCESPEGVNLIARYRATKAFLSAGWVNETLGVTCADSAEAELKKAAVASSQTRILLTDSRKFGSVRPSWFADLADFDAIITDSGISLDYVEIIRKLGIALHVV